MKKSKAFFSGHRRWLSILMVFALVMGMMPSMAFATDGTTTECEEVCVDGEQSLKMNPGYKVEYYAWLNVLADSGSVGLDVIDTDGGKLPTNSEAAAGTLKTKRLYLSSASNGTLQTKLELTQIYKDRTDFTYYAAPGLNYIDQVTQNNGNYTLKEVWAKSGTDGAWTIYSTDTNLAHNEGGTVVSVEDFSEIEFVNSGTTTDTCILITEKTVIRLVYTEENGSDAFETEFYDYDITDGTVTEKTYKGQTYNVLNTDHYGINSNASGTAVAFGNDNAGTDFGKVTDTAGYYINKGNGSGWITDPEAARVQKYFQKAYYGLVSGISSTGNPVFANGITGPNLFSGSANGKHSVPVTTEDGNTMDFSHVGDTYTLTGASIQGNQVASGLNTLSRTIPEKYNNLWSNSFWPVDSVSIPGKVDPNFGGSTTYYYYDDTKADRDENPYVKMPVSDNGVDHNSYFGLTYDVDFTLPKDYVGPMNYLFFGDDDMWVYLINNTTGETNLVVDIGGVHQSIGEYVDLWDYIDSDRNTDQEFTLRFFYTERGASGSTCFMQFTLPQVHPVTPAEPRGTLELSKKVEDVVDADRDDEFEFVITFKGSDKLDFESYTCIKYLRCGKICYDIFSKAEKDVDEEGNLSVTVKLKSGQRVAIENLPSGVTYTISEKENTAYDTQVDGNWIAAENGVIAAKGTIPENDSVSVAYTNVLKTGNLIVTKTLAGSGAAELEGAEFEFIVELDDTSITGTYGDIEFENGIAEVTLEGGESIKAEKIPAGIGYTVTEKAFTDEEYSKYAGYIQAGPMVEGIVEYDSEKHEPVNKTAEIVNRYDTGSLTVMKAISGEGADLSKNFDFTVTLSDNTINGTYGQMEFTDGVATFELGNDGSMTATDLPAGIKYTVTEDNEDYSVTKASTGETIPAGGTAIAKFENYKGMAKANLTAKKLYDGKEPGANRIFTFQLQKADGTVVEEVKNTAAGEITFTELQFTKVGTYEYNIVEVQGDNSGIVYDGSKYQVKIVVKEVVNGADRFYESSITYTKDGKEYSGIPTFNNSTYVPTTFVSVSKVWDDDNDVAGKRPSSITVQLLKNGTVYDTETLNASNSWSAKWSGLNAYNTWTVNEVDVPEGYTSSVSGSGGFYTITNTYTPPEEPVVPDTPDDPDDPTTNVDDPDVPKGDKEVDDPLYEVDDPDVPKDGTDVPKTDDSLDINIWLMIAALSGMALAVSVLTERKHGRHEA